jgi:hypothetical protein
VLGSDEYWSDVAEDIGDAGALGATGAPLDVIDRRFGVSGAQPSDPRIDRRTTRNGRIVMVSAFGAGGPLASTPRVVGYVPGVCNIGPAEIARRRRSGHVGLAIGLVVLAGLVAIGAPPLARLILVLPVAAAASGYLQAWLKFCAGFGSRGIFNFGALGPTEAVVDPVARAADRARARAIIFASLAIGVVIAVAAFILPL